MRDWGHLEEGEPWGAQVVTQQGENYPQGALLNRIRANELRAQTLKHFSPGKVLRGLEKVNFIPEELPAGTH